MEVAVNVAVPTAAGVKTPALLTVPAFDGDADHETPLLPPAPVTEAVQADVWFGKSELGHN